MPPRRLPIPRRAVAFIQKWLGRPAWEVNWDTQAGLMLKFGTPRLEVQEPHRSKSRSPLIRAMAARRRMWLRGTHRLWVEANVWEVALADGLVANRRSSQRSQRMACARLKGEKPTAFIIDSQSGAAHITFDLGGALRIRCPRDFRRGPDPDDLWSISDSRRCFHLFAGAQYFFGSINTPIDPELYAPFAPTGSASRHLHISTRQARVVAKRHAV